MQPPKEDRLLRLKDIIGDPQKEVKPIIPVSASTWWKGIREGRYPKGVKLSARVTAWRLEDIQKLVEGV